MPSRQKAKGSSFERKAATLFSAWWGAPFLRTPNSGAMRRNGAAWDYGDLTPPDDFPCTIECKHERPAKLLNSILNGTDHKNTPLGWWAQARSDAERCRKETGGVVFPLVVYKIDRQPPRMLMEIEFLDAMRVKIKRIDVRLDVACFSIVNVDEFFEKVSKQMFLRGTKAIVPSFLLESA